MIIKKAYKFRLYPDKGQVELVEKTFGCCRWVWNQMLGERIEVYNKNKDNIEALKLYKYRTEKQYKEEKEWLKEVDSVALQQTRVDLDFAYKSYFRKGQKSGFKLRDKILKKIAKGTLEREVRNTDIENHPQFKNKKDKQGYRTVETRKNIEIDFVIRKIKLPKLGWVRYRDSRIFGEDIRSVTVSKTTTGKYYASVLVEEEIYPEVHQPNSESRVIGLDYSSGNLYVDDKGDNAGYPRYYRKSEKKLKREQRSLSRKEENSKNREKQRVRVARVHEKIGNRRRDFLHKLSNSIVKNYDIIGVEDLDMRGMSQSLNLGKSTMDNGYGMFLGMLEYKCEWRGKHLIFAGKRYASSKMCSNCGYKNAELKLGDRRWECPVCRVEHDRDKNAGINLANNAKEVLGIRESTVGTTGIHA